MVVDTRFYRRLIHTHPRTWVWMSSWVSCWDIGHVAPCHAALTFVLVCSVSVSSTSYLDSVAVLTNKAVHAMRHERLEGHRIVTFHFVPHFHTLVLYILYVRSETRIRSASGTRLASPLMATRKTLPAAVRRSSSTAASPCSPQWVAWLCLGPIGSYCFACRSLVRAFCRARADRRGGSPKQNLL